MMKNKFVGVYKITCISNEKVYIGSSQNISQRWKQHLYDMRTGRNGSKGKRILHEDFLKYGSDNFKFEILKLCTWHEARWYWEGKFINEYDSSNSKKGYNTLVVNSFEDFRR